MGGSNRAGKSRFCESCHNCRCYETPLTVKSDATPEIVASFIHLWMMKAAISRLEADGLLSPTQIQADVDKDLSTLAAMWPRDEADLPEDCGAAVARSSVREAERKVRPRHWW